MSILYPIAYHTLTFTSGSDPTTGEARILVNESRIMARRCCCCAESAVGTIRDSLEAEAVANL